MKTLFLSIILALAGTSFAFAQEIFAQNFAPRNSQIVFSTTLTTPGPLEIVANAGAGSSLAETVNVLISVDGATTYFVANSTAVYTTGSLAAGTHTVGISAGYSNGSYPTGGAILIAPNEPPSGIQSSIVTINGEINSLQQSEQSDANTIATLQATQGNQASQISALQTAEANDASLIAGLQTQLQTIETTLQAEITQDEANIVGLQNGQNGQTGQITTLQSQVAQLQQQVTQLQAALAAIPPPATALSSTSQFENLQNQIHTLKSTNQDQWMTLGAVGLLGATGTAISAFELSQGGRSSVTNETGSSAKSDGSYTPYASGTSSGAYSKKN